MTQLWGKRECIIRATIICKGHQIQLSTSFGAFDFLNMNKYCSIFAAAITAVVFLASGIPLLYYLLEAEDLDDESGETLYKLGRFLTRFGCLIVFFGIVKALKFCVKGGAVDVEG